MLNYCTFFSLFEFTLNHHFNIMNIYHVSSLSAFIVSGDCIVLAPVRLCVVHT